MEKFAAPGVLGDYAPSHLLGVSTNLAGISAVDGVGNTGDYHEGGVTLNFENAGNRVLVYDGLFQNCDRGVVIYFVGSHGERVLWPPKGPGELDKAIHCGFSGNGGNAVMNPKGPTVNGGKGGDVTKEATGEGIAIVDNFYPVGVFEPISFEAVIGFVNPVVSVNKVPEGFNFEFEIVGFHGEKGRCFICWYKDTNKNLISK